MNYTDIHVVESFEEAEQFRYEHNDQTVEVGTPVGYNEFFTYDSDSPVSIITLKCFDGIYYSPES